MARFNAEIPNEIIKQVDELESKTEEMMKAMTQEAADVVLQNIRANAPAGVKESPMMGCLIKTKAYKTPSDEGINTKVGFSGYFTNENGKRTPAPLVANVFEYGRSNSPFPKQPFIRKSFKKAAIEAAMKKVEDKYIPK